MVIDLYILVNSFLCFFRSCVKCHRSWDYSLLLDRSRLVKVVKGHLGTIHSLPLSINAILFGLLLSSLAFFFHNYILKLSNWLATCLSSCLLGCCEVLKHFFSKSTLLLFIFALLDCFAILFFLLC